MEGGSGDGALLEEIVDATDHRWARFFGFDLSDPAFPESDEFLEWYGLAYDLRIVQPFNWSSFVDHNQRLFFGEVLHAYPADVAVQVLTALVRADRTNEGLLADEFRSGRIAGAVRGLWAHHARAVGAPDGNVDSASYSDDLVYRWWYERRFAIGPVMTFIGLNPATGDTDGRPRPTLAKVCRWAAREGCGAVRVVNLSAYRATKPAELRRAEVDIVGSLNDAAIADAVAASRITLGAWGAHGSLAARGATVAAAHPNLMCVGTTANGEPAHPLFIPNATPLRPYVRRG